MAVDVTEVEVDVTDVVEVVDVEVVAVIELAGRSRSNIVSFI